MTPVLGVTPVHAPQRLALFSKENSKDRVTGRLKQGLTEMDEDLQDFKPVPEVSIRSESALKSATDFQDSAKRKMHKERKADGWSYGGKLVTRPDARWGASLSPLTFDVGCLKYFHKKQGSEHCFQILSE